MRSSLNVFKKTLLILSFIILAGCNALGTTNVDDLRLASMATVNLQDHPEVDWLREVSRPSLKLLRIGFETRTNLESVSKRNEFNITNSIFFCNDGAEKYDGGIGWASFSIYSRQYVVDPYVEENKIQTPNTLGIFTYYIYMDIASDTRSNGLNQIIPAYDLRNRPSDLCVHIRGGNMLGGTLKSNIFKIPRGAISAAQGLT
jgi:hypothetical protein